MKYKIYWFPTLIAAILISAAIRTAPHFDSSIEYDRKFSERLRSLPSRVSSGEISADSAVNYVSHVIPIYLESSTTTYRTTKFLLYSNAILLSLSCFLSAYIAQRTVRQAHNKSFKGTPNGAP